MRDPGRRCREDHFGTAGDRLREGPRQEAGDRVHCRAKLARAVTLAEIKAERSLAKLKLVTHSRLSVMPIEAPAFERILLLSRMQPKR